MTTSEQILVVFLSTALAILLILAIVVAVLAIRLLKTLGLIAEKAEQFIESAESAAQMVRRAAGPLNIFGFVRAIVSMVNKHSKNNKEKD